MHANRCAGPAGRGRVLLLYSAVAAAAQEASSAALPGDSLYQIELPLTDQTGRQFAFASLRGRAQLVSMFYTSRRYVCPLIIDTLKQYRGGAGRGAACASGRGGGELRSGARRRRGPGLGGGQAAPGRRALAPGAHRRGPRAHPRGGPGHPVPPPRRRREFNHASRDPARPRRPRAGQHRQARRGRSRLVEAVRKALAAP